MFALNTWMFAYDDDEGIAKGLKFNFYKDGFVKGVLEANRGKQLSQTEFALYDGVTINIYNTDVTPPYVEVKITSQTGQYKYTEFRNTDKNESGKMIREDIVQLRGSVYLERYAQPNPQQKSVVIGKMRCDEATWNNHTQLFIGTVDIRTNPNKRVEAEQIGQIKCWAEEIRYEILDSVRDVSYNSKGKMQLLRNTKIEVLDLKTAKTDAQTSEPKKDSSKLISSFFSESATYEITCDNAIYEFFEKPRIQFNDNVLLKRLDNNLEIRSECMQMILAEQSGTYSIERFSAWVLKHRNAPLTYVTASGKTPPEKLGERESEFHATGEQLHYNDITKEITLSDQRMKKRAKIEFDSNTIEDAVIQILDDQTKIVAFGGTPRPPGEYGEASIYNNTQSLNIGNSDPIQIQYVDKLLYDKVKNQIYFENQVYLKYENIEARANALLVELLEESNGTNQSKLKRLEAKNKVMMNIESRKLTAEYVEIIPVQDIFVLNSKELSAQYDIQVRSAAGMPDPVISDETMEFTAPQFTMEVYNKQGEFTHDTHKPKFRTNIFAQGPGNGYISQSNDIEDMITIAYKEYMILRDDAGRVYFKGDIRSSYTNYLLTSSEAHVFYEEVIDYLGKASRNMTKLVAVGNERPFEPAKLYWNDTICDAFTISQFTQNGRKYVDLKGTMTESARVIKEKEGKFIAPSIQLSEDQSTITVISRGPGSIELVDQNNIVTKIEYQRHAAYLPLFQDELPSIMLLGNIVMKRVVDAESTMIVRADKMVVRVDGTGNDHSLADFPLHDIGGNASGVVPAQWKEIIASDNVMIEDIGPRGTRIARGSVGKVVMEEHGEVLTLTGFTGTPVVLSDPSGVQIRSNHVRADQATKIVTASGPGEVTIPSTEAAPNAVFQRPRINYILTYAQEAIYNPMIHQVRFEEDVKLVYGNTLRLEADVVTAFLTQEIDVNHSHGREQVTESVSKIEATGFVDIAYASEQLAQSGEPEDRFLSRSDIAIYNTVRNEISLETGPTGVQPEVIFKLKRTGNLALRGKIPNCVFNVETSTTSIPINNLAPLRIGEPMAFPPRPTKRERALMHEQNRPGIHGTITLPPR